MLSLPCTCLSCCRGKPTTVSQHARNKFVKKGFIEKVRQCFLSKLLFLCFPLSSDQLQQTNRSSNCLWDKFSIVRSFDPPGRHLSRTFQGGGSAKKRTRQIDTVVDMVDLEGGLVGWLVSWLPSHFRQSTSFSIWHAAWRKTYFPSRFWINALVFWFDRRDRPVGQGIEKIHPR